MPAPCLSKSRHPRYEYRVTWYEGRKYFQKFFRKDQKREAEKLVENKTKEMDAFGTRHGIITPAERAAIGAFREATAGMDHPPTLQECVSGYLASIRDQLSPITVRDLVERRALAAERKGVHDRTLRDLVGADGEGGRLGAFSREFGERQAASVTAGEIDLWADGRCRTAANKRELLVRIRGLFAFGVKRKLLRDNPVNEIELPRQNAARAAILTVAEARALLACCSPRILPAVAVQLFAGLRHAEVERLQWKEIEFDDGIIRATQRKGSGVKRERTRFVPVLPPLIAFLADAAPKEGMIFPTGRKGELSNQIYRKDFLAARTAAGLTEWDPNTLRHCYGSYRVASIQNIEQVKIEMGHTTSRTTAEHYLNAVRAKDAAEFWALVPAAVPESA